jgi:hypothetical protein
MSLPTTLAALIANINVTDPYDHVETGRISSVGGQTKITVKTEAHYMLYVRRPMIVAHYTAIAAPLGYRRYTAEATQQDRLVVAVSSGSMAHTSGPVDAAAWSSRADDTQYMGWLIRPSSSIVFDFTHLYTGTNSMNVPIDIEVILSGYRIPANGAF